ncbi:MAG: hypothetical protein IKR71_06270 [Bacteroidales bacterium]|nr:hypothetical protein [Bacteroidales bacterium]
MIKQFCITTLFVFISVFSFAQDIIETIDAKRIEAKILEVSETEIKYKEIDNIEGPTFILSTNKIRSITYANGKVSLFQDSATEERNPNEPLTSLEYITRTGERYTYKGHVMQADIYANFLENNCPSAFQVFKKGHAIAYTGIVFLSIGIGIELGTLIGSAIAGGYTDATLPLLYCALGFTAASIPLVIIGYHKMHQSVDIFNQTCANNISHNQSYWSINASQRGIGLVLNF